MCVCLCVCVQALAKRFVWASVGSVGHSSIPSSRANIIQFPRIVQPIPSPLHTHMQAHTAHARYTKSIIFTLTTGAVCKHRGLLTLKYSFGDYPP